MCVCVVSVVFVGCPCVSDKALLGVSLVVRNVCVFFSFSFFFFFFFVGVNFASFFQEVALHCMLLRGGFSGFVRLKKQKNRNQRKRE